MAATSGPLGGAVPDHRRARTVAAPTPVPLPDARLADAHQARGGARDPVGWRSCALAGVQTGSLVGQATELDEFAAQVGGRPRDQHAGARPPAGARPHRRRARRTARPRMRSTPPRSPPPSAASRSTSTDAAAAVPRRRRAAGRRRHLLAGRVHPVGGADRPAAGAAHRGHRHGRAADDLRQLQPDDRRPARAARRAVARRVAARAVPGGAAQRADRPGQGDRLADAGPPLRRRPPGQPTRPTTSSCSATCGRSGSRRSPTSGSTRSRRRPLLRRRAA